MNVVANSRLVTALKSLLSGVETAFDRSLIRRSVVPWWTASVGDDPARVVAFAGSVVAVAMSLHIVLTLFLQPYPFPSRAALILPAAVLIIAVLAVLMRDAISAGWRHRRAR